jgi:hypothetical protein
MKPPFLERPHPMHPMDGPASGRPAEQEAGFVG